MDINTARSLTQRVQTTSIGYVAGIIMLLLNGCSSAHPYLVASDDCNCEEYRYEDPQKRFTLVLSATYTVNERITTHIELTFRTTGRDTLSMRQAYLKATSNNVDYQYNGMAVPFPFITVPPGEVSTVVVEGSDTKRSSDPWLKIAGERIRLEIKSLMIGGIVLPPIVVTLVPLNPKLTA